MNLVDEILKSRGYGTKAAREAFLSPEYEATKYDPFLLPDMEKAVARLVQAWENKERVVIYGDYDIDGLTASTVLLDSFTKFGIDASVFIPNRFVEGYGLSADALERIADGGGQLVVTVDCGSLSHTEIAHAGSLGLDVIVTDHHSVAETMPEAVAVVNPKRLLAEYPEAYEGFVLRAEASTKLSGAAVSSRVDVPGDSLSPAELGRGLKQSSVSQELPGASTGLNRAPSSVVAASQLYPFVDLAGVGVAFKLVQALQTRLEGLPAGQEKWLLDLVAFGTVCDVVSLVDENRTNVYWGLMVMQKTRRIGLKMLMAVSKIDAAKIDARALGFGLGPRLNASGRLKTAQYALDLLTTTDGKQALALAEELDAMNRERRAEQDRIFQAASEQALLYEKDSVLVVSDASWSHGIIGIVAAKLLEKYHKPTFVLQELEDGTAKGSARSFGDFSAVGGIRATETLLLKGGGHMLAAGVTMETVKIGEWRESINAYHRTLKLENQERHFQAKADVTVGGFESFNEALLNDLRRLEPYGNGNPEPVFRIQDVMVAGRRTMGSDGQHVRYTFEDRQGRYFSAVAWRMADKYTEDIGETVDVWLELTLNEWQGRRSVEGRLLRLESSEDQ